MEKLSTSIKSIVGEDTCTKVYSTEDQKIIGIFPSYTKACAFLGVRKCDLSGIVKKKAKHFSKALQKEVVVRLGLIKELEPEYVIDNIVKIPATFASATYPLAAIDGEWNFDWLETASLLDLHNLLKETLRKSKNL